MSNRIKVQIIRDRAKMPNIVQIDYLGRKLEVKFDPARGFEISGDRNFLPPISEILKLIYPVQSVLSVRGSSWFDRNPEPEEIYHIYNTGPHVETPRWIYTVPPDKIAFVEIAFLRVMRATAADAAGLVYAQLLKQSAPAYSDQLVFNASINTNGVGDTDKDHAGGFTLYSRDKLVGTTYDGSTAGTVSYIFAILISEIDA